MPRLQGKWIALRKVLNRASHWKKKKPVWLWLTPLNFWELVLRKSLTQQKQFCEDASGNIIQQTKNKKNIDNIQM